MRCGLLTAACCIVVPNLAWAHPGHGTTPPGSAQHFLLEPVHAVPVFLMVLALGAAWGAKRIIQRRSAANELARDQRPAAQEGNPHRRPY